MTFHQPLVRTGAGLVGAAALALLCACSSERELPTGEPSFYRSMAASGAQVDAVTAASMISGYRTNNGLTPVTVDPALMKMAEAQAQAMASRDKLDHDVLNTFRDRLKQGYRARTAAENVGAGYHTLAEAFSGWRDSPPHRANMLLSGATRMGIATAYAPKSKFKVFWALILAEPDERPG
jgi:uncharacterized protein YkwD